MMPQQPLQARPPHPGMHPAAPHPGLPVRYPAKPMGGPASGPLPPHMQHHGQHMGHPDMAQHQVLVQHPQHQAMAGHGQHIQHPGMAAHPQFPHPQHPQHPQHQPHPQHGQHPQHLQHGQHPAHVQHPQHPQHHLAMPPHQPPRDGPIRTGRKPADRQLPDGIAALAFTDHAQLYNDLRAAERRLDALVVRKRLELIDPVSRAAGRTRTRILRLEITNTATGQSWQQSPSDKPTGEGDDVFGLSAPTSPPSFRLTMSGRLLPDPDESDSEESDVKMSDFFYEIGFDFPAAPHLSTGWSRQTNGANGPPVDYLSLTRTGDQNLATKITLVPHTPHRPVFALSTPLSRLLDTTTADRASVMLGLWQHLKTCPTAADGGPADDLLRALLGQGTHGDADPIAAHLAPLPNTTLDYTVRTDQTFDNSPTVYDIPVQYPPARLLAQPSKSAVDRTKGPHPLVALQTVVQLDDALAAVMRQLAESKARWTFFNRFSKDPVRFVSRVGSSLSRDASVILCEAPGSGGVLGPGIHKSGAVWASEEAEEAVAVWAARRR